MGNEKDAALLDASKEFPAGTRLYFQQSNPPEGWLLLERIHSQYIFCEKE